MAEFITNTQISVPLNTGLRPDVNLNGLMFSYEHGLFYQVTTQQIPITLPPPFSTDST